MNDALDRMSRLVTAQPRVTLIVIAVITAFMAAGATLRAAPAEPESFLPPGGAISHALREIDMVFGDSGNVNVVTLLFRGEAMTPAGLSQMSDILSVIAADPEVSELLVQDDPIVAPTLLLQPLLRVSSFEQVTQDRIDSARDLPDIQTALERMSGVDIDGSQVAVANIRLRDTGDKRIENTERKIHEMVSGFAAHCA